ncbi:MAG TPA: PVC-type heme-binding CxxCH protein [Pirellulales bacterium]|nr:PVC-type heme-binding CxxCH protein [Pirellulales bacterium]
MRLQFAEACLKLCLTLFVVLSAIAASAQDAPVPLHEAAGRMKLPEGFSATLFAGEPDVVQPIAFAFDDRGRLWVVECLSYPDWQTDPNIPGHDRVLVFDDRDGDGRFDERKVFLDSGQNLSGIELGFGGVWLCSTPNLLFVPDADRDDRPDGPPRIMLDGWDLQAKHNVFNGLAWGPDGWLYGLNGILSNSQVGRPGTPPDERTPINCGVWRYHPLRETFEVVCHGTTNPWGLDFDEYGQAFFTNCVIHHLWQAIPGGHYQRMYGQDFNPHLYSLMTSPADHIHWAGGPWQESRGGRGEHDQPGGGHAHSGAMIYLGDNWPDEYRGDLFTCNIHGSRVNRDRFERRGSATAAHHGPDFLYANDPWFRGLTIKYSSDGGVYVSDWCDSGECHDYDDVQRTNGRIYKITYGKVQPRREDLADMSDAKLVELQLSKNDWQVAHARRLLQERAAAGQLADTTPAALAKLLREHRDVTRRLRALWALHACDRLAETDYVRLLADDDEDVRAWAVRLSLEQKSPTPELLEKLAERAAHDPSPRVRLELASALQRLPLDQRWPIAQALVSHADDAADPNLPLMDWYGIEPLVPADADHALELAIDAKIPRVREYLARRLASGIPAEIERQSPTALDPLVRVLGRAGDAVAQLDLLRGVHQALAGRRRVLMPKAWPAVYDKLLASDQPEIREQATLLALMFGDERAAALLRREMLDQSADVGRRQAGLAALVQQQRGDLLDLLGQLLAEPAMRGAALRGLAACDDQSVPQIVLRNYASFSAANRDDALATLASRPAYALALLDAIEQGKVARGDLSAFVVRQLAGIKDAEVARRLAEVWGAVRETPADKAATIARFKSQLTPERLKQADRSAGRALFVRHCAACHKLFGEGGQVGPELTGAQRGSVDYLLENMIDPSALVGRDYQLTVIETTDGRVLNGIVTADDGDVLTVQTQNERVLLPKNEIDQRQPSKLSLMPEGVLDKLSERELRDLIGYLAGADQPPLPAGAEREAAGGK